jgi:hypothetical protein
MRYAPTEFANNYSTKIHSLTNFLNLYKHRTFILTYTSAYCTNIYPETSKYKYIVQTFCSFLIFRSTNTQRYYKYCINIYIMICFPFNPYNFVQGTTDITSSSYTSYDTYSIKIIFYLITNIKLFSDEGEEVYPPVFERDKEKDKDGDQQMDQETTTAAGASATSTGTTTPASVTMEKKSTRRSLATRRRTRRETRTWSRSRPRQQQRPRQRPEQQHQI